MTTTNPSANCFPAGFFPTGVTNQPYGTWNGPAYPTGGFGGFTPWAASAFGFNPFTGGTPFTGATPFNGPGTFTPWTNNPFGFNTPGFNTPGFNTPGFNTPGFHNPGFNGIGFNTPVFNTPAFNTPAFNGFGTPAFGFGGWTGGWNGSPFGFGGTTTFGYPVNTFPVFAAVTPWAGGFATGVPFGGFTGAPIFQAPWNTGFNPGNPGAQKYPSYAERNATGPCGTTARDAA